jgi:hypothetical protein
MDKGGRDIGEIGCEGPFLSLTKKYGNTQCHMQLHYLTTSGF